MWKDEPWSPLDEDDVFDEVDIDIDDIIDDDWETADDLFEYVDEDDDYLD